MDCCSLRVVDELLLHPVKVFRQLHLSLCIKTPESALQPAAPRAQNFITTHYTQRLIKRAMANISTAYISSTAFSLPMQLHYLMDIGLLITFTGELFIYQYIQMITDTFKQLSIDVQDVSFLYAKVTICIAVIYFPFSSNVNELLRELIIHLKSIMDKQLNFPHQINTSQFYKLKTIYGIHHHRKVWEFSI